MEKIVQDKTKNYYMGFLGAVLPFIVFVSLVILLSFTKGLSSKTAGAATFISMIVAFLTIRDKAEFSQIVYRGLKNHMLGILLSSFLLAGVMAMALEMGGLVTALVWVATEFNISGGLMPAAIFIIVTLIGLATGTNAGTIVTTMPIMLPLGIAMGCDPGLVMGAVVGGAMWGDNIAPISDTTIVSALTQETEVAKVVKARFKYAGVAGLIAFILYIVLGITTTSSIHPDVATTAQSANPLSLLLLLAPAFIIYLMLKGKDIIYSLLIASALSILLDLALGLVSINKIITSDGVVVKGFESMMGIFPFFMFMFCLIEVLHYGGVIEWIGDKAVKASKTPRTAELISALICTITYMITTVHSVSVVVSGPVVRSIMKNFNIDRARSANTIDCIVSGLHGIMPHSAVTMISMGLVTGANLVPKDFVPMDYLPYVFPSWMILIIFFGAIITGWGRKPEMPQEEFERLRAQELLAETK